MSGSLTYSDSGNGGYSATTLILAGACLGLILYIIFPLYTVDMWRGEIDFHAGLQLKAINAIRGADNGSEVANGLTAIYHRYPKMLYDLFGVIGGLVSGSTAPESQKAVLITIQMMSFLALIAVIFRYFTAWFGRTAALLVLLLVLTDQYFQVYAVFPRQNILSNMFGFWALLHYLHHQWFKGSAGPRAALTAGVLAGLAVLAHYAALELVIIIAALQGLWIVRAALIKTAGNRNWNALLASIKAPCLTSLKFGLMCSVGFIVTILAADILYFILRMLAADLEPINASFSVIDGLRHTIFRVHVDGAPAERLRDASLYEGVFYLIRVVNPVLLATCLVGGVTLFFARRSKRIFPDEQGWLWVGIAGVVLLAMACQRFFSPARLMVFYLPIFFLLFCTILRSVTGLLTGRNQKWFALYLGLLIVGLTMPRTLSTHQAIRSNAVLAAGLSAQGLTLDQIAQWGGPVEVGQNNFDYFDRIQSLCDIKKLEKYSAIYTSRIVPIPSFNADDRLQEIFQAMRDQDSIASVKTYASLSLYRSEFPLRPDWFDFNDKLSKQKQVFDKASLQTALCANDEN